MRLWRLQTGKPHPEDRCLVTPPESVLYLYRYFQELCHGRPVGGMGVLLSIPHAEILAWQSLSGVRLEGWELDAIRDLDAVFLKVMGRTDD